MTDRLTELIGMVNISEGVSGYSIFMRQLDSNHMMYPVKVVDPVELIIQLTEYRSTKVHKAISKVKTHMDRLKIIDKCFGAENIDEHMTRFITDMIYLRDTLMTTDMDFDISLDDEYIKINTLTTNIICPTALISIINTTRDGILSWRICNKNQNRVNRIVKNNIKSVIQQSFNNAMICCLIKLFGFFIFVNDVVDDNPEIVTNVLGDASSDETYDECVEEDINEYIETAPLPQNNEELLNEYDEKYSNEYEEEESLNELSEDADDDLFK